jgi:hypothetical protein
MDGIDAKKIILFWAHPSFQEAWIEWWTGKKRRAQKCSDSDRALTRALTKIKKFSGGNMNKAIAILDRSSDNGWTDLYELPDEYRLPQCSEKMEVSL